MCFCGQTHLRWGDDGGHGAPERLRDECLTQDGDQVVGHELLLVHAAVVLQGQDHWVVGCLHEEKSWSSEFLLQSYDSEEMRIQSHLTYSEGVVFNGFDNVSEEHFGGESVAVVNNRLSVSAVPTVQLHTATTLHQSPARKEDPHNHLLPQRDRWCCPAWLFSTTETSLGSW